MITGIEEYREILKNSALFHDLNNEETEKALAFFRAFTADYMKGEQIHHAGETFFHFGLVLRGSVHVCTDDLNGRRMIMHTVTAGETFGESLCFLQKKNSKVYIFTPAGAFILWLSVNSISEASEDAFAGTMRSRFIALLANRTLTMNQRIQTLSKLTLREKLITYFTNMARQNDSLTFNVPFSREDMAAYLGTNRSALSRELAKMQQEGIIEFYRDSFRIKSGK